MSYDTWKTSEPEERQRDLDEPCDICGEPSDLRDVTGVYWCEACAEGEECSNCDLDVGHPCSCQFI